MSKNNELDLWMIITDIHPSATQRFDLVETKIIDTQKTRSWPWPKNKCPFSIGDKVTISEMYAAFPKV